MYSGEPRKLKRVVIKEELVHITGDYVQAIILNQFLYWSDRIKDVDQYINEEITRAQKFGISKEMNLANGWIYKTADELSDETMLNMSTSSMRRHIKKLIDKGFLIERNNPEYRWDQTKQYRVDLLLIQMELLKCGYPLDGYHIPSSIMKTAISKIENGSSNIENQEPKIEIADSILEDPLINFKDGVFETGNRTIQNESAIPETTTEITTSELDCSADDIDNVLVAYKILPDGTIGKQLKDICKLEKAAAGQLKEAFILLEEQLQKGITITNKIGWLRSKVRNLIEQEKSFSNRSKPRQGLRRKKSHQTDKYEGFYL